MKNHWFIAQPLAKLRTATKLTLEFYPQVDRLAGDVWCGAFAQTPEHPRPDYHTPVQLRLPALGRLILSRGGLTVEYFPL